MKAIITVLGQDRVGIIASVSTLLAANSINILDISQTTMQSVFTMIMHVDMEGSGADILGMSEKLADLGKEIGLEIRIQHEGIFNAMHRM
ncbi:MAG: ACT domain-containing protein [Clostridia bacterium]